MKTMMIIQGILLTIYSLFTLTDLYAPNEFDPFFVYYQNEAIRQLFLFGSILNIIYAFFYLRIFEVIRVKILYSSAKNRMAVNSIFVLSQITLFIIEKNLRGQFYYGEVSDKHIDIGILFIVIIPILLIVFDAHNLANQKNKMKIS